MRDQRFDTCWASAHRFCVAQPCPQLYEACHLQRVTALRGGQKGVSHIARAWGARRGHNPCSFFATLR